MGHKEPEPGAGATQDRKHLKLFSERLAGRAGGRKRLVPWEWAMKGGPEQGVEELVGWPSRQLLEASPQALGPHPTSGPFADSIWQKKASGRCEEPKWGWEEERLRVPHLQPPGTEQSLAKARCGLT